MAGERGSRHVCTNNVEATLLSSQDSWHPRFFGSRTIKILLRLLPGEQKNVACSTPQDREAKKRDKDERADVTFAFMCQPRRHNGCGTGKPRWQHTCLSGIISRKAATFCSFFLLWLA